MEVKEDSWEEVTGEKEKRHAVIHFYSPWSGNCKRFAPTFTALASAHKQQPEFVFARVDGYANMPLARKHGVKRFPTIKYFHKAPETPADGETVAVPTGGELYAGPLTVKDISKFIATTNFLARFKPPPPPPPAPWMGGWIGLSTSGSETMTIGEDGSISMTETFEESWG